MTTNSSTGISFTSLLAVAFIVLKLIGYIDRSWWWVLSPLWLPAVVGLAILLVVFCISVTISLRSK